MASGIVESSQSGNQDSQNRTPAAQTRARLVQKLLAASADLPSFIRSLIETQGVFVAGTEAAAFLLEQQGEKEFGLRPIAHVRPDESSDEVRARALEAFADIVRPCVVQGKDGVIEVDRAKQDTVDPQFCLVTLLRSGGNVVAVSAVITRCPNMARAQQRLTSMELVAGYFEMYMMQRNNEQARLLAATHQNVLQLATAVATAEGFESSAMNLCNELAARTGATRVAIGWLHGNRIKLKAMSHTEKFDKKQELSVLIVAAMEECIDQEEVVQYEPDGKSSSDNVTRAAAELSRRQGGMSVLSLPLRRGGDMVGVVTLEFNPQKKIGPNAATGLTVAVELLSPQLFDRFQNDRWLVTKAGLSTAWLGEQVFRSKKHMLAKLLVVLAIASLLFVTFYKKTYRVVAPFQFTATDRRVLSAPFDGFVSDKINVKPGDRVKAGDLLMEMDTKPLELEMLAAQANAVVKHREAQKYRAENKQAEALQALAEEDAAMAEVELKKWQIEQARVKAPVDGVVLSGDWFDKRRAPVRKGEELFRIAEGGGMRIEMSVNERDIQRLRDDGTQTGYLATTSLPDQKFKIKVERIVPLPTSEQGKNVFKVYALPTEPNSQWREGMQGEARVDAGEKSLLWIWTHPLIDWLRLKLWI